LATAGTAGTIAGTESAFVPLCQQEEPVLNDTRIRNAKPRERDYKLTDFDGLYILVRPNGRKLWRFAYRLNGKQK
jgi:Arm DNA-binding domain